MRLRNAWVLALLLSVTNLPLGQAQLAQAKLNTQIHQAENGLVIEPAADGSGITLSWQGTVYAATGTNAPVVEDASGIWHTRDIGDHVLPVQFVSVVLTGETSKEGDKLKTLPARRQPALLALESANWQSPVPFRSMSAPQDGGALLEEVQPSAVLPNSPVFFLHEGYVRNLHIAVLAVSPIYAENGITKSATQFRAHVQGVRVLQPNDLSDQFDPNGAGAQPLQFLGGDGATAGGVAKYAKPALNPNDNPGPPSNVSANANNVWKVLAKQAGLQTVTFASIQAASGNTTPSNLNKANWHVRHKGQELAIWLLDADNDSAFNNNDTILFYAPEAGDRFNTTTTYWLSHDATAGSRMQVQNRQGAFVGDPTAVSDTGIEKGRWVSRGFYESKVSGNKRDHFFAYRCSATYFPSNSSSCQVYATDNFPNASFTLANVLPSAGGSTVISASVHGDSSGWHNAEFAMGGFTKLLSWSGATPLAFPNSSFSLPSNATAGSFRLVPTSSGATANISDRALLEYVDWERRASLSFGSKGALFSGLTDATYIYQLTAVPPNRYVFDITNPLAPIIIGDTGSNTTIRFKDSPSRVYVLDGTGINDAPQVVKHTPVNLSNALNFNALYVGPRAFLANVAPLVALRNTQGYVAGTVAIEDIYDAWGYGQISSVALRNFLRYAAATWSRPPLGVTLIGDGSADPKKYLYASVYNNNFVPAYLLDGVDTWINEAACDTCYAQLNTDNPLTEVTQSIVDPNNTFVTKTIPAIMPDMWIGRLPVNTTTELDMLVSKIKGYEEAPATWANSLWRRSIGLISDDFQNQTASTVTTDSAGNFFAFSEASVLLQPSLNKINRVYFDPCDPVRWAASGIPNFNYCYLPKVGIQGIASATNVHLSSRELYNNGNGIIVYNGHGNRALIGTTGDGTPPIFNLDDVNYLTNASMLPIVLQMTCYTSEFQNPYALSLDESLLLRASGGAVATWGSTGLGVAHGHDKLQQGFFEELWQRNLTKPPMSLTLGQLTTRGYFRVVTEGGSVQDTVHTFHLLGDPFMRARVMATKGIYLPTIRR